MLLRSPASYFVELDRVPSDGPDAPSATVSLAIGFASSACSHISTRQFAGFVSGSAPTVDDAVPKDKRQPAGSSLGSVNS